MAVLMDDAVFGATFPMRAEMGRYTVNDRGGLVIDRPGSGEVVLSDNDIEQALGVE